MNTCPACGVKNEAHYKFCLGCGSELPSNPIIPTPPSSGWTQEIKIDPQDLAGKDVPPKAPPVEVAPSLKEAQAASTPSSARVCGACGSLVAASFTFCGQCGARMDAAPTTLKSTVSGGVSSGRLVLVRADGTEGASHPLSAGENAIGRGRGPLFDTDGYLSPFHASITLDGSGVTVKEEYSLNGVFLRLVDEEELFEGDVFRVGQELLAFQPLAPAEPLEDGTHIMGSPPADAWARLVLVVSPDQEGSAFTVAGETATIGRERGDIVFSDDGYVSGSHARVAIRDGRYFLADLNSSNGTFIRLRAPRVIPSGALLLMGQQLFRVVY